MPARIRDGLVFPATAAELIAGAEAYKSITPAMAKSWLWPHGEVRLVKNGSNLELQRDGLGRLIVNGKLWQISASSPPTLAATGTVAGTLYYIYAYETTSNALALEASTTAFAIDAATGIAIKTGDATRTLVGMAVPITGPAWSDTQQKRYVLSYFNRKPLSLYTATTAARSTTSISILEISADTERAYFLKWADVDAFIGGLFTLTTPSSSGPTVAIGRNALGAWTGATVAPSISAGWYFPVAIPVQPVPGAVLGVNYATMMLQSQSGAQVTIPSGLGILTGYTWG